MTDVKLTAPEARRISAGLGAAIDDMTEASKALVNITADLSTSGMQGTAGTALAAKQAELHQQAEKLANVARERAAGLSDYANVVEAGQAEDAARINGVG
ncbi:MAG: hypothetical protein WAW17_07130 [Rhodococcus sp. (in: high G+C Gram-positive bacteria)]|uniref:hypothetical protein n=1 Tax=Rhodococcus sp. TaxID=1831 RepID=UPI003BAEE67B